MANFSLRSNAFFSDLLLSVFLLSAHSLVAQNENPDYLRWIDDSIYTIVENHHSSDPDWSEVGKLFNGKEIILLGEFSHGSREVFEIRHDLIKYLHKKLGYKNLLFESGIGEFIYPEYNKSQLTPTQMCYSFFGGWRTAEHKDLMKYVKENELSIAGFDVQRTGGSFRFIVDDIIRETHMDTSLYGHLEQSFGAIQSQLRDRNNTYDSLQQETRILIKNYKEFYNDLNKSIAVPVDAWHRLVLRTLHNRVAFLNYMLEFKKDNNYTRRWQTRDSLMAANIIWLKENIYNGDKIIVVGHNYHTSKYNVKEKVMGEFLLDYFSEETIYSIGMFAGQGEYYSSRGGRETLSPGNWEVPDIKHIIQSQPGFICFLPTNSASELSTPWLHQDILVEDTFIDLSGSNKMTLSKCFDSLVLIKQSSLPVK